MILASHIIISGILGSQTQNYFLAAIIGFASHYVLDAIPHWDYLPEEFQSRVKTDKEFVKNKKFWRELSKVAIDGLAGLVLLLTFAGFYQGANIASALISAFFGILPDALSLLYWITKWRPIKWNHNFQVFIHYSIFKKPEPNFWPGIVTQIMTIGIFFLMAIKF